MKKVAIISKDLDLIKHLKQALNDQHFNVDVFSAFSQQAITDIVLVDEDQLNLSLVHVCERIQSTNKNAIVIALSSEINVQDKITLLNLGFDDALQKPIQHLEVIARIHRVLKRIRGADHAILSAGDLSLDVHQRTATVKNHVLQLTNHEFLLLSNLAENKGVPVSRIDLMNLIWGYHNMGKTRPVDNLIKRLRRKLIEAESKTAINTVWGEGYKIENE